VRTGKRIWSGRILKVDRFGNLITNFHISEFPVVRTRPFSLVAGQQEVTRLARTFADVTPGEVFAIVGSSGYLEIVANQGSAARMTGSSAGAPAELTIY